MKTKYFLILVLGVVVATGLSASVQAKGLACKTSFSLEINKK